MFDLGIEYVYWQAMAGTQVVVFRTGECGWNVQGRFHVQWRRADAGKGVRQ